MTKDLKMIFDDSFSVFLKEDRGNIINNVSEQNLCGLLATHITIKLRGLGIKDYWAETEYNRKQGGEVKTIIDDEMRIISITSDLIVHSRGAYVDSDNLITIEMKKASRPNKERISDRDRLRAMTKGRMNQNDVWSIDGKTHPAHVCGYHLGVYIIINTIKKTYTLEYYRDGEQFDEVLSDF